MARYNEILVGRFNRLLQKYTQLKGSPPAPQLAGEIMPTIPFEDIESAELRFIASWNRYGTRIQQAAVAAQNSAVQLRNPAGSNVIAVVESIVALNALTDNPTVFAGGNWPNDLTTVVGGGVPLDLRQGASQRGVIVISNGANAVVGGGQGASVNGGQFPANQAWQFIFDENQEMPLPPGSGIAVWSNVVNQAITVCYLWRERFLEESERQ